MNSSPRSIPFILRWLVRLFISTAFGSCAPVIFCPSSSHHISPLLFSPWLQRSLLPLLLTFSHLAIFKPRVRQLHGLTKHWIPLANAFQHVTLSPPMFCSYPVLLLCFHQMWFELRPLISIWDALSFRITAPYHLQIRAMTEIALCDLNYYLNSSSIRSAVCIHRLTLNSQKVDRICLHFTVST